jgi:HlyD family secretion protein
MPKLLLIVLPILLVAGSGWYWHSRSPAGPVYKTVAIRRGDVAATISATGSLEPEEVVDVGAQVEGLIVSFGQDSTGHPIYYRSPVEPNMVLARIDDTVYKADVDTASAQLEQARTAVLKGQADVGQAEAKLLQAQNNWNRAKTLGPSDALSQNDYEMFRADYATAKANVAIAETEIAQAKSGVLLAQATLSKAQRNFEFCTIRSPVKGVIIDRRVNIGQTVVSSLNAPSLFLIAKDLTRMQIWVAVNEADIGRIVPGSPVTFSCDAFPGQVFQGRVGIIRLNATMNQNVVMYTVEVEADNASNILLPYLTAKLQFEVERQTDVLMVPNASLRWNPASTSELSPDVRATLTAPVSGQGHAASQPKTSTEKKDSARSKERRGTVWIKDGVYVRPLDVSLGTTDGVNTAVFSERLHEGDEVVTSETNRLAEGSQRSPFLPQNIRR